MQRFLRELCTSRRANERDLAAMIDVRRDRRVCKAVGVALWRIRHLENYPDHRANSFATCGDSTVLVERRNIAAPIRTSQPCQIYSNAESILIVPDV